MSKSLELAEKVSGPLPELTADEIDATAKRISDIIEPTPLQRVERLSARSGANVFVKREDLTPVRSYKLRGAYNLIVQLTDNERSAGVVTASAGNHAQGVAFACRAMGIQGRIYVPTTTPKQKRDRIRAHGGRFVELIAIGDTYDAAAAAAAADVARTGATAVHPFDDPRTAAGQGTVAVEILDQLPEAPDLVIVPVGGGGCLSGIGTYLRERSPRTAIVGVEPSGASSMTAALVAGGPVTLPQIDPFVDGAAVRRVGDLPYRTVAGFGGRVVSHASLPLLTSTESDSGAGSFRMMQVDEGAICTTMLEMYQSEGIIAEPAGALAVTALAELMVDPGSTVVCLVSGGNNDVSRYGEIIERSLVHQGLKHYFLVDFPQEPGALRRFLDEVLGPDDDITLFEYVKRNNRETGAALVGIELGAPDGLESLLKRLHDSPIQCERLEPGSPAYRYLT
ncbi:threonine ammonia-lyase IlvA [Nocardia aurantia]|uniref:L-threonine dehydratase biosynthetic IlvA n=1 Tax=Nocardia aurantia TaxID=2585199 RepID=A0A7K0DIS2_9NOCA|nr:threonine ammonia-lyase IlvA [Nocardia aurantia]MQY25481.1 L-threonine dehydratase biosynthetic IlvA [Nocardia aurantia]